MSIEENIRVEEIRVLNCPSVARINLALTPNPLPTTTLILLDRPVCDFWAVHFATFGPYTLILLDRPVCDFWTVHFFPPGPSTFIQMTVHFDP